METAELLLEAGFEPKRSIVLSFGFDEEISGHEGAGHLAPFLIDRYGKDGIAAIVDEGSFFSEVWGSTVAAPGTGEKGYTGTVLLDLDSYAEHPLTGRQMSLSRFACLVGTLRFQVITPVSVC